MLTTIRPYGAEDNNINQTQVKIIQNYCNKNNEIIIQIAIYKYAVQIIAESGREFNLNFSGNCGMRNIKNYFYMKEMINGKQVRIKKSEW